MAVSDPAVQGGASDPERVGDGLHVDALAGPQEGLGGLDRVLGLGSLEPAQFVGVWLLEGIGHPVLMMASIRDDYNQDPK